MATTTHEIDRDGNIFFLVNAFIGAYNRRTDMLVKAASLAISKLERILNQMSALSDAVQAVADDQKRIADDVAKIIDLLSQPNPDVAAAVTALQSVDASLDESAAKLEAALPPAPPVV